MKSKHLLGLVAVLGTLAVAAPASAQYTGDLDLLTHSVPPNVIVLFDTSDYMRFAETSAAYAAVRGFAYDRPTNNLATRPAAYLDPTWAVGDRPNCTLNAINTKTILNECPGSGLPGDVCPDDNHRVSAYVSSNSFTCWNVPGGCASLPAGFACTSKATKRSRAAGGFTTLPNYTIGLPDWSESSTTYMPRNYLWWIMNEIYRTGGPVPVPTTDRNQAARAAISTVIDQVNLDGSPERVKFGLAKYKQESGGHILVPVLSGNKVAMLSALATIKAEDGPSVSESLVDVARYLAGGDLLGDYSQYARGLDGSNGGAVPPSPYLNSCENTYIIVVTAGVPEPGENSDANNHHGGAFASTIGDYDADGLDAQEDHWLDDVALYIHDHDLRPKTLQGFQNAYTYVIGYNEDAPVLAKAAKQGEGMYRNGATASEIAEALKYALNDVIRRNTSQTAVSTPALRSAFSNALYTAYFLPGGSKSTWKGFLEAYSLTPSLALVDKDGDPALNPITDEFIEPRNPHWEFGTTLLQDYASRTLYATKAGARANFTTASITAADLGVTLAEQNLYPHDPVAAPFASSEALADGIVRYLHGFDAFDEDRDADPDEPRPYVLGDIFHSSPLAVAQPLQFLRGETGYGPASDASSFMSLYAQRERVVYVGSNDGMLHAIEAGNFFDPDPNTPGDEIYTPGDGDEKFGWVPGFLMNKVKLLPRDYVAKGYFVDGSPSAADVWLDLNNNGVKNGSDWTTALVVPMREGAEGLLALDVTDPTAVSGVHGPYPRLMFEFTHSGLGQTWSRPILTRVKMRGPLLSGDRCGLDNGEGDCAEVWVAIFGAGWRPQSDPNLLEYTNDPNAATYTEKGRGVYIVRLDNGAVLAHLKQNQADAVFSKMRYAIAADPAVIDSNFDGFADVVYIGDAGGQVWKWDLSAIGDASSGTVPTSVWPAGRLFEAPVVAVAGGRSHYHSIFQGAAAAMVDGAITLSVASGERTALSYLGQPDPADPNSLIGLYDDNNRFWVMKDAKVIGLGSIPAIPIREEGAALSGEPRLTDVTNETSDPDRTDAGYFFRVADGEKFITNHIVFSGVVVTLSYVPEDPSAPVDPDAGCTVAGTTNQWAWELDSAAGSFDAPDGGGATVRNLVLGNGAPTDPRLTLSKDLDGKLIVKITAQTSTGQMANPDAGNLNLDPVDMIYWRQNF